MKRLHVSGRRDRELYERVARTVMCGPADATSPGIPGAPEVKIAHKNSLGLEFVAHFPEAVALRAHEEERLAAFWQTMHETSALFAGAGIPHIYIKFRKLYRYYDSNVDVIVRPAHWRPAITTLAKAGYKGNVMFKEPDKVMFSRPGQPVSVHLHPGVTWNGVSYFDEDALWDHSCASSEGGWRELSPEYDFLINLAHNIFENYEISLGDMLYFHRRLQTGAPPRAMLEPIARQNGWGLGFRQALAQVESLAADWARAGQTGMVSLHLLAYPYAIAMPLLARAFWERITSNLAGKRFRPALREAYAYPAFYALKRRHDLPVRLS